MEDLTDSDVKNEILRALDAPDLQNMRNVIYEGTFIQFAGWEEINDFCKKDLMLKGNILIGKLPGFFLFFFLIYRYYKILRSR